MRPIVAASLILLPACTGGGVIVDDIWVDTGWRDTEQPPDTGDTDDTSSPTGDQLTLTVASAWDLTPSGGPYTGLTGTWTHHEELNAGDAEAEVICDVAFDLSGDAGTACDTCDWAVATSFSLTSGDRDACHSPDAPIGGDTWTLAWRAEDATVLVDWNDSGTWIPLYTATLTGDQLSFEWSNTVLYQD